jgi:predicted PurR-regulated permease PerM
MTLYYTLVEGGAWRRRFVAMLPLRPELADGLVAHFREVSVAVLVGGIGTSVVQMVVAALGFWLLGFDAPVFWALVTGLASFVPIVGTALVYVPLAIVQGIEMGWGQGLMTFAYGMVVIGTVDNLVRPLLVRSGMHIHPLLVFLAVFGGFASLGTIGLFLGPLLMATTVAALEIHERRGSTVSPRSPSGA